MAVVAAVGVAAAAVAAAMVAEDGLAAARWSCLPISLWPSKVPFFSPNSFERL